MRILIGAISTAVLAVTSQEVLATSDVFRFVGHGPVSTAMGGAATAFDVGAAGMMTNPATLSLMPPGSEIQLGLDFVLADIEVKNQATGETAPPEITQKTGALMPPLSWLTPITVAPGDSALVSLLKEGLERNTGATVFCLVPLADLILDSRTQVGY